MAKSLDLSDVVGALDKSYPDRAWLRVLETFLIVGVADNKQLQRATGFSRDRIGRIVRRFQELDRAIVIREKQRIPRAGQKGRGPVVYRLGKMGAALLRQVGYKRARACELQEPTPIGHALSILDLDLAARSAGLQVETERALHFEGGIIRPDLLITLPDGSQALFEIEQTAGVRLLRRMIKGLRNKLAFFRSPRGQQVSSTVRVLFNLQWGRQWEATVAVWERALAAVAEEAGGSLPFRLLAMPLRQFLEHPDWSEPPRGEWESLFDPARMATFGVGKQIKDKALVSETKQRLPRALQRTVSSHDDRLILQAMWQVFEEQAAAVPSKADPAFFDLMGLIYAASHSRVTDPLTRASLPRASLYLLKQYLGMHPELRQALNKAVSRGGGSMRWSAVTILHRMEQIIRLFLKYHGFTPDGPLRVYPDVADYETAEPRDFQIRVRITDPELLMPEGDSIMPGRDEVREVERALSWVLQSLFIYAEDVGLRRAAFW